MPFDVNGAITRHCFDQKQTVLSFEVYNHIRHFAMFINNSVLSRVIDCAIYHGENSVIRTSVIRTFRQACG